MKNIHVIPTNKASRLSSIIGSNFLQIDYKAEGHQPVFYQNIYITSDEEIKKGDWCYHPLLKGGSVIQSKFNNPNSTMKKIILTTDQDLIKDGVQAIDEEFLEWFVKNPSCEYVEVEIESKFDRVDGHYHDVWEIIIPKEDNIISNWLENNGDPEIAKQVEQEAKELCEQEYPTCGCGSNWFNITTKNKPFCFKCGKGIKQETLEEASKKYALNRKFNMTSHLIGFRKGAKWQAERMYSEEEVRKAIKLYSHIDNELSIGEILQQFKKK